MYSLPFRPETAVDSWQPLPYGSPCPRAREPCALVWCHLLLAPRTGHGWRCPQLAPLAWRLGVGKARRRASLQRAHSTLPCILRGARPRRRAQRRHKPLGAAAATKGKAVAPTMFAWQLLVRNRFATFLARLLHTLVFCLQLFWHGCCIPWFSASAAAAATTVAQVRQHC